MIVDLRNKKPFLHFGFNRQEVNAFVGEEVTVYQDVLYNENYTFEWGVVGSSIITENENEIKLKYGTVSVFDLDFKITNPEGKEILSDIIVVNCKFITADTNRITADSSIASADGSFI